MGEFKAGSLSYYSATEPHMLCSSPGLRVYYFALTLRAWAQMLPNSALASALVFTLVVHF